MTRGDRNRSVGAYGESVAARRLVEDGMVLVDRNWRCDAGEIDLVLREGEVLVFCEVKTRRGVAFGHPLEAVGRDKAERLGVLAGRWMHEHDVSARGVRIDLVGVLLQERGAPQVTHVRGVG
jgi:putative endonuclease